jgi:hypothetical protein
MKMAAATNIHMYDGTDAAVDLDPAAGVSEVEAGCRTSVTGVASPINSIEVCAVVRS